MLSTSTYFANIAKDEQLLAAHGFDHWPTDEELARYLMDTNDRMDALCKALSLRTVQDVRGRWTVRQAIEGAPA